MLTLCLVPLGGGPLATALRALRGMHAVVTLGQLQASTLSWRAGATCFTCENPAVLRAAERRLGVRCPPLVCTEGWPSDAARLLLRDMRAAGWRIRHHGDFDLGGAAIMQHLTAEVAAEPWRFDVSSYEHAVSAHGDLGLPRLPRTVGTGSGALERALCERGSVVCEELLLDVLVADLADE